MNLKKLLKMNYSINNNNSPPKKSRFQSGVGSYNLEQPSSTTMISKLYKKQLDLATPSAGQGHALPHGK
jgi:hypothetical protein